MALAWRATVQSKGVIHESETLRLLRVRTSVEIYDTGDPGVVIKAHAFETKYQIPWIIGMSMADGICQSFLDNSI